MSGVEVELPDTAWWVALAGLPSMGPARLRALEAAGSGRAAWELVARGRAATFAPLAASVGARREAVSAEWVRHAAGVDVAAVWEAHRHLEVVGRTDPQMPERLAADIDPPSVLFADGSLAVVGRPTVAIVGTRRCSRAGAELAFAIGQACAAAGACVASGLAVGVDTAAHRGALAAGPAGAAPVAVVGSGLDVVYPERSAPLWRQVARAGAVLSEYPLGVAPARWRFPARNRIVAALADVVVVVESGRKGGSMYTVDEALRRDRTVMAVPGSVRAAASEGTNWLLSQGASVACGPDDVLAAVGLDPVAPARDAPAGASRPRPDATGRQVLRALGWDPATLDALAERTALGLGALAVALDALETDGWVERLGGVVQRRSAP